MSDVNLNAWWCRQLAAELVAGGIELVFGCPGNRNVPLLFALAATPGLRLVPHQEERGAAFAALGAAKASGRPVAVCTTSGSAVANCLPTLCEADQARLPLVLLSADRPPELLGCEAPQTMIQAGVFTTFLRAELALPAPAPAAIEPMRDAVAGLLAAAADGPVHLNIPLRDPLPPLTDPSFVALDDGRPGVRPSRTPDAATSLPHDLPLRPGLRGLIVAGPRCPLSEAEVARLATITGYPVLADAPGTLRRLDLPGLLCHGDLVCAGEHGQDQAELIIRLGPAPIARSVWEFLQLQCGTVLRIDDHPVERDFCHDRFHCLLRPGSRLLGQLAEACAPGDPAWAEHWATAERTAQQRRQLWLAQAPWGEALAAARVCATAHRWDLLHLANSLALRHGNLHLTPATMPGRVSANRGVNGIDGTLATFIGQLLGRPERRGLLLCGDLAFLHDLPSLELAAAHPGLHGTIVVLDNGGGGIFDLLPVGSLPGYRELVRTPSHLDAAAATTAFGIPARICDDLDSLIDALDEAATAVQGFRVIVAQVPSDPTADFAALLRACT